MAEARIGVQPIIYGKRNQDDFPGVLREAKETGYVGVETGDLSLRYSKEEARRLFEENGLVVTGCHSGFDGLKEKEQVESAIEYLKDMGAHYLMVSGVGRLEDGLKTYDSAAELFDRVGRRCNEEGITFCYHNHAWEFDPIDGKIPMHYLCEHTDPALVKLCIDVYWVHVGGEDPATFIRRYADRAAYFHFKDGRKGVFSELGLGDVDFDRLMPAVQEVSPEWIVYEQDRSDRDPKESLAISRKFLKERLGL